MYKRHGYTFTAKGKTTLCEGWCEIEKLSRAASEEQDEDAEPETVLPPLAEGQTFDNPAAEISERYTQPPKAYTEDTLLSAMENAGKEEDVYKRQQIFSIKRRCTITPRLRTPTPFPVFGRCSALKSSMQKR